MFRNYIATTAFTTPQANNYFMKIRGDSVNGDNTFLSTLRALLVNRIGGDTFWFSYWNMSLSASRFHGCDDQRIASYVYDHICSDTRGLTLVTLSGDDEANTKVFEASKNRFCDAYGDSGWVRLVPVSDFFMKTCEVLCFVNPKIKKSVLIVKGSDIRFVHCLQTASLVALPWYFNPKNGDKVSDIELQLLNSLRERRSDSYLQILQTMADQIGFEEEFIRKTLVGIEEKYEQKRFDELKTEIESYMNKIQELRDRIGDIMKRVYDKNIEYSALDMKLSRGETTHDLYDYFKCNKTLKLDDVRNETTVIYHVNDYISYFDENVIQTYIDNRYSVVYKYVEEDKVEAAKRLVTALFIDQTMKIRTCAAYQFDITGGFDAICHFDFGTDAINRMPNPHLQYHACIGDYQAPMYDCMQSRNYIGYIEQTIASAKTINFGDGIVVNELFSDLFGGKYGKCIELEDGRLMDVNEAMEYVMEGNENE